MPDTVITCFAAPGVGGSLSVVVTVGSQTSPPSIQTLRYKSPVVSGLSGLGAMNAPTTGGTTIIISGNNFGPLTQLGSNGLPVDGPASIGITLPLASYSRSASSLPSATGRRMLGSMPVMQAINCFVSVQDVQIVCTTAPGVGASLVWAVTIGSQTSAPSNATSSYSPPSIADYMGPGASGADTVGSQAVIIDGHNFGPVGTVPDSATYGGPNATQFVASGCVVTTDHVAITCATAPGAGAALKWLVVVGGQYSVYPTTSYAVPLITGLSGPGARDASSEGGQVVNIAGQFFSFGSFLERVTYGPSGSDYVATSCSYVSPHVVISCLTVPGTGRVLRWLVTVGGQTSALSAVSSSYELPDIVSVTPSVAPSSGGGSATLLATGLALLAPAATQTIYLETCYESAAYPQQADIDAYWAAVQSGAAPAAALVASVQPWIASLTTPPITSVQAGTTTGGLVFTIPPGLPGCGGSFWVTVSGVPSAVGTFDYASPFISNAGASSSGNGGL